MVEKIRFFLYPDALTELEDQYIGKENELRKELQTFIKNLFANAKAEQLNKILICRIEVEENGVRVVKEKQIPFDEIDFTKYVLKHDPEWRPPKIKDAVYYELAVGDATYKKLLENAVNFMVRVDKYNNSLSEKTKKNKIDTPTCFEEIMFQELYHATMGLILKKVGDVCDAEFEELNKLEDKPKKETINVSDKV